MIIGGSYVGLEFGQMYRRFGSAVTVIETGPRLTSREDPEISAAIADILRAEGIDVRLDAKLCGLSRSGDAVAAAFERAGERTAVAGSHLLLATGRRPNTDDLGLDRAGVRTDERGFIKVDDTLATNVPGIWALGECNGHGAFTHTAYNDAEIVAANLLDGERRRLSDRIPAYAMFIDPPLGRVGLTETEARAQGHDILVGSLPMEDVSRAFEKGETLGLMKIVVDRTSQQILGATILGTGGDEAVHCILDLMYARAPYPVLQRAMHIHPTVCEFIPSLLEELAAPT